MKKCSSEETESFPFVTARRSFGMKFQHLTSADKPSYFHFRAATGFGAIVDGSGPADSTDQVASLLLKQGLIPVRIWPEPLPFRKGRLEPLFRTLGRYLLGRWRAAH